MTPVVAYQRTQTSLAGAWALLLALVLTAVIAAVSDGLNGGFVVVVVPLYLLIGIVIAVFARLTVTVNDHHVTAAFGWGWPARTIEFADIHAVVAVRNSWWYGWGLRWIPRGTMYNVWGRDAVELELADDRVFRIGTDDVVGLRAALESGIVDTSRR
ncbi:MAG: hypothetical protein AAGA42_11940 [Actinomycetota bacterium]